MGNDGPASLRSLRGRIRLIVTDLDGTLFDAGHGLTEETARVFARCRRAGMLLAVATARPARAVGSAAALMPDYILSNNGATVARGERVLRNLALPPRERDALLAGLLASPAVRSVTVEAGDRLYTDCPACGGWEEGWNPVCTDFRAGVRADVPKISAECADPAEVLRMMEAFPDLRLYGNRGEAWCQITRREATKLNALRFVLEREGLDARQAAAFGDDENDAEMLAGVGAGVAVSGASETARRAARFACGACGENGVARWIAAHLLA